MSGLEIFNLVAYGHTVFHRDHDAWDLIDEDGLVAAVLCPRTRYLTISLPPKRQKPKPVGRKMAYDELKAHEIHEADIDRGRKILAELVPLQITA